MNIEEIRAVVLQADPTATRYFSVARDANYTTWHEFLEIPLEGDDDVAEEGWRFQVDRFTRDEDDPAVDRIKRVLRAHPGIGVEHSVLPDPQKGWIHHVFQCRGL